MTFFCTTFDKKLFFQYNSCSIIESNTTPSFAFKHKHVQPKYMSERLYHSPIDNGGPKPPEQVVETITIDDATIVRLLTMREENAIPREPTLFLIEWNNHTEHNPIVFSWTREQLIAAIGDLERAAQFRRKDREEGSTALNEAQEVFRYVLSALRAIVRQYDRQHYEQSVSPEGRGTLLHPSAANRPGAPGRSRGASDASRGEHPVVEDRTDDLLQTVGQGEVGRASYEVLQRVGQVAGRDVRRFGLPPSEYVHLRPDEHITARHLKQWYALGEVQPGKTWRVPGNVIIGVFITIPSRDPRTQLQPVTVYHRFTDEERQLIVQAKREKPVVVGRPGGQRDEEALSSKERHVLIRPDEIESGDQRTAADILSRRHVLFFFERGRLHVIDISRNHGVHLVLPKEVQHS